MHAKLLFSFYVYSNDQMGKLCKVYCDNHGSIVFIQRVRRRDYVLMLSSHGALVSLYFV